MHIVSESGRAIVAHHSVLVVEAFGSIEKGQQTVPGAGEDRVRIKGRVKPNAAGQNPGDKYGYLDFERGPLTAV